jgi:hypothetical protein
MHGQAAPYLHGRPLGNKTLVGLAITLCPIVRLAQHLAVLLVGGATLAPSRDMVCVHVREAPYFFLVGLRAHGAERAVRFIVFIRFYGLRFINFFLIIASNARISNSLASVQPPKIYSNIPLRSFT